MTLQDEGAREGEAGLTAVTYVLHSLMNGAIASLFRGWRAEILRRQGSASSHRTETRSQAPGHAIGPMV